MMRFVLLVVVVSVFVSGGSVAAQSPSGRSPAVELSVWDTATLLRLRDLLEVEIARRGASGDLAALQDRLQPALTPPSASGASAAPNPAGSATTAVTGVQTQTPDYEAACRLTPECMALLTSLGTAADPAPAAGPAAATDAVPYEPTHRHP